MHRHNTPVAALLLLLGMGPLSATTTSPHLGVEIGPPEVRVVTGPDDERDLTVSFSVRVKNTTDRELDAKIIIQGLDRDGNELHDLYLNEAVKPGQERTFTQTDFVKEQIFKSVITWRVEEATIRGGQPDKAP